MRIAVIAPPWFKISPEGYGGIEVVVHLLVEGLVDRGHDVHLCVVGISRSRATIHSVFDDEMKEYLDAPASNSLNMALTHSVGCYTAVRNIDAGVIHDHTWKEGLLAAAFLQVPIVRTIHDAGIYRGGAWPRAHEDLWS